MSKNNNSCVRHPSGIPGEPRDRVVPLVRLTELRVGNESFGGWGPRLI